MSEYTRKPRASRRNKKSRATRTLLVVCMMLVVMVGSIAGTVAWLTATSDKVTNTFTVGDINITLAETTGTEYKIVPGGKDGKNPTVTVNAGSEKCYVYALVENNVVLNGVAVATPNVDANKWNVVGTNGTKTLYRYSDIVDASSALVNVPVFTEVSYADSIQKSDIEKLSGTTIIVTAYAHQSDNIEDVSVANAAANAWAGTTAAN